MSRNLFITIHEGGLAGRRRTAQPSPPRAGTDPGSDYLMAPPDDPGSDYLMAPPDDPGSDYLMAPPGDPGSDYLMAPPDDPSDGVTVWSGPAAFGGCCCCKDSEAEAKKPELPGSAAGAYSGFVIVRTAPGVPVTHGSLWELATATPQLPGLKAVLELELPAAAPLGVAGETGTTDALPARRLVSRPLIELSLRHRDDSRATRLEELNALQTLEQRAMTTSFRPLHSLTSYWRVDARPYPDRLEEIVAAFNRLAEVDLAYRELAASDPEKAPGLEPPIERLQVGASYAEDQGYLADAPAGIGAAWAWQSLGALVPTGQTASAPQLALCDLEQGWHPKHEGLAQIQEVPVYGANRAGEQGVAAGHHGTAVLGELAATGGPGVLGTARGAARFILTSHYRSKDPQEHPFAATNGHVAAAIVKCLLSPVVAIPPDPPPLPAPLQPGDVLLLEVQRGLRPTEVDPADLDAIRLASALGVIVVEAAGNGGFDLDRFFDPETGLSLRRGDPRFRDSGAILVGASRAAVPHERAPFSNFGSRLDCFAWGEAVTSCGYGDLAGTAETNFYTNTFNGTSSASPIIAGAAVLVQALHLGHTGCRLEPRAMRALLSDPATGTRQGPNVAGFIGIMPDLRTIVRGRLGLAPDPYLRRTIEDDGAPGTVPTALGSSPDILLWDGDLAGAKLEFGEGPKANAPAPGAAIQAGNAQAAIPAGLYLRLRNRGGADAPLIKVRLFVSPASTLITPERWVPAGEVTVKSVTAGDALTLSERHDWKAKVQAALGTAALTLPAQPLSFLAVVPEGAPAAGPLGFEWATGLPPGPPYFDWLAFRTFMRRRGVAWRNAHMVRVPSPMTPSLKLPFLISGTPDQARHFDFEVLQRLPKGIEVRLHTQNALLAKLRQGQGWWGSGAGALTLPRSVTTTFRRVRLNPGLHIPATFEISALSPTGPPPVVTTGHSLTLRQLWKGEEVGRVTWWFVG